MNRSLKRRFTRTPGQQGVELENHFVLRLQQPQANAVRELLRSNQSSNIKDRLNIQLDYTQDKDDMRNGIITVDTIMYKSRLVDLPTVIESWKTIDGKNFYKTADICQMLMVREGEDPLEEEDSKKKRKDHPNRVDKKYLWPHGYTPPVKNVRKRRFRKMLRKKILELPEIEKEVKRLLRADEEALNVKWEVLREDEERGGGGDAHHHGQDHHSHHHHGDDTSQAAPTNLDEQLFGEMVSSSEDEGGPTINIMDEDEDSRLSVDDTRFSEPYTQDTGTNSPHAGRQGYVPAYGGAGGSMDHYGADANSNSPPHYPHNAPYSTASAATTLTSLDPQPEYVTEFTSSMFRSTNTSGAVDSSVFQSGEHTLLQLGSDPAGMSYGGQQIGDGSSNHFGYDNIVMDGAESRGQNEAMSRFRMGSQSDAFEGGSGEGIDYRDRATLQQQLARLESELAVLGEEEASHQSRLDSLDNLALKSRFQSKLLDIQSSIVEKREKVFRIRSVLQN